MSKINNAKSKVLGYISAMRTMIDNYPQPKLSSELMDLLNSTTPFGFLMNVLNICGVSSEKLLNFISKILCGKEVIKSWTDKTINKLDERIGDYEFEDDKHPSKDWLTYVDQAIKALLLTNIKNLFTCSINPIIPNEVLKNINNSGINSINGRGIKIPISTLDMFNVLSHSPKDDYGSTLYFDVANYQTNELWKSTDFNAFLWYIVNRSTNTGNERYKCIWDNRIRHRQKLAKNKDLRNNFFNIANGDGSFIPYEKYSEGGEPDINYFPNSPHKTISSKYKKDSNKIEKKQYVILEYEERSGDALSTPDILTIYLNADRYRKKIDNNGNFYINKTVFEFNFDFIYSIKLFDSKTLVANIINSLLGITRSVAASILDVKYTLTQKLVAEQVKTIVKKLCNSDDTIIDDCFYSFSNDEYDAMLKETQNMYSNGFNFGDNSYELSDKEREKIKNSINNIDNSSTLKDVQTNIKNVFYDVSSIGDNTGTNYEISDKLTFGNNILFALIEETVVQIVLQVLSPKIVLLFAINSYFLGDNDSNDFSNVNVKNFLKGLNNLIVELTKQIFDLLLKELIQFAMNEIRPLLIAIAEKLILERVRFYIDLFKRLYALLMMFYKTFSANPSISKIDNINFAEITNKNITPNNISCSKK